MYGIQFVHFVTEHYTNQTNYLFYNTLILLSVSEKALASASLNTRYFCTSIFLNQMVQKNIFYHCLFSWNECLYFTLVALHFLSVGLCR